MRIPDERIPMRKFWIYTNVTHTTNSRQEKVISCAYGVLTFTHRLSSLKLL